MGKSLFGIVGLKKGFIWCLHCERVFDWGGLTEECPWCGATPLDFSVWGKGGFVGRSELKRKGYPIVPVHGGNYPLYPKGG